MRGPTEDGVGEIAIRKRASFRSYFEHARMPEATAGKPASLQHRLREVGVGKGCILEFAIGPLHAPAALPCLLSSIIVSFTSGAAPTFAHTLRTCTRENRVRAGERDAETVAVERASG